jgi:hypothetical protein
MQNNVSLDKFMLDYLASLTVSVIYFIGTPVDDGATEPSIV